MNSRGFGGRRGSFSIVMIGVLAVLLPLLAFLQYRWIGQVSESERERLEENLSMAAERFVEDLSGEFFRISMDFRLRPRGESLTNQLAQNYEDWQATAPYPGLLGSIYILEDASEDRPRLFRFDPVNRAFSAAEWPSEVAELAQIDLTGGTRSLLNSRTQLDQGQVWMLARLDSEDFRSPDSRPTPTANPGWMMVELDSAFLWSELIPNIIGTYFDDRDYRVAVVESVDSGSVLYTSDATLTGEDRERADASIAIALPRRGNRRRPEGTTLVGVDWQLIAQHRAGSLEGAVNALRRRNLAVGFGILAILGASGAMIIVWSERVRSVGRLQMELAAGMSHELRTPLATIRSAAHNLASGVVERPEEVREYAGIVQTEGRRLSWMVDQVILFAQTEAGRRHYNLQPIEVERVVDRALATALPDSGDARTRVETNVPSSLPLALADETALAHCLGNLLTNALKFGMGEARVRLDAAYDGDSRKIVLTVADSGPGIDPEDLTHIFEPFYRGHETAHIPGSGLGLSLVRRMIEGQNGEVSVSSTPGEGTIFTLHVPVAEGSEETS